jgi:hypothetical protein
MARSLKSSAKAERADHRLPPDERLDRDAAAGLLSPEELDRAPDSRLTMGDIKRASAKAKGTMGSSKKLDPSLLTAHTRKGTTSSSAADGAKKSRAAPGATQGLDRGSVKTGVADSGTERVRTTRSNAEIAEGVPTAARKSPAPLAATAAAGGGEPGTQNKRTGGLLQRAPAPGNATTVTKREAVGGPKQAKETGIRSTSSTGGARPPKTSARGGTSRGGAKSKGADGNRTA